MHKLLNILSPTHIELANDMYLLEVIRSREFAETTKFEAIAEVLERLVLRNEGLEKR